MAVIKLPPGSEELFEKALLTPEQFKRLRRGQLTDQPVQIPDRMLQTLREQEQNPEQVCSLSITKPDELRELADILDGNPELVATIYKRPNTD